MSARVVLAVAVALLAGPVRADEKVAPMDKVTSSGGGQSSGATSNWSGGGSSGGFEFAKGASSGGGHAVARGSSSSSSRSSSRGEGRSAARGGGSSRGHSRGPETDAQRRHPRPGSGTGSFGGYYDRGRGGRYYGGSRYNWGLGYGYGYGYGYRYPYGYGYDPFWYSPYYYSGYYGYSPSYYRGGYYRGYGYRDGGSLRLIVDPERTRVYVDGYYAGVVDDFDGIFQRLNIPPGRHEITLRLEGYRTQHFRVYVPYDRTIKIHWDMVRGSGEATSDEFAGPPADYARVEDMGNDDDRDWRDSDRDRDRDRDGDRDRGWGGDRGYDDRGDGGIVRLQVRPGDASVYVDGELRGSGRNAASLRLRPGRHRIEVVRPGYRTLEREVEVRAGQTTELEFDLDRM